MQLLKFVGTNSFELTKESYRTQFGPSTALCLLELRMSQIDFRRSGGLGPYRLGEVRTRCQLTFCLDNSIRSWIQWEESRESKRWNSFSLYFIQFKNELSWLEQCRLKITTIPTKKMKTMSQQQSRQVCYLNYHQ